MLRLQCQSGTERNMIYFEIKCFNFFVMLDFIFLYGENVNCIESIVKCHRDHCSSRAAPVVAKRSVSEYIGMTHSQNKNSCT